MSNRPPARRAAQTPSPVSVPKPVVESAPVEASAPKPAAEDQVPLPRWVGWLLGVAEGLSIAGLFVFMLSRSWLKWMDPLIDFPKDLYMAWRVSQGDMLYRDVTTWYGPLPQLTEGAGFHVFGVGIDTIVWMNIVLTVGVLLLVWAIFGELGNRLSRWLCLVVFIVVFAFGHFTSIANYNFIAPYVAQSTYGFAGLVLLLWALLRQIKSPRPFWLVLAGFGLAVAYVDKPEPLLASLGALVVYVGAGFLGTARKDPSAANWRGACAWVGRTAAWGFLGFLSLWLPLFIYFACRGGFAYALLAVDYVPHTVLNARFQDVIEHSVLMQRFFGFDEPWPHFMNHLEAGGVLLLIVGVMLGASWVWSRASRFSPEWCFSLLVMLATAGVGGWLGNHTDYWMDVGTAFVFPVILVAAMAAGWAWWDAWRGRTDTAHLQSMAVVGTASALMMARMVLHGRIYQFGFFMMPLAVLFVVHLVVGEVHRLPSVRPRAHWLMSAIFTALVLYGVTALGNISLKVYASKTASVGEGRDQFFTFPTRITADHRTIDLSTGSLLNMMIHFYRVKTPNAKTLVAFPEGIAANYHLRVRSPLAEMEFHPVALGYVGVDHVLDELKANPPDAVILHYRTYAEFHESFFGSNAATGRPIILWVVGNYERVAKGGQTKYTATGTLVDLLRPMSKPQPKPGAQPLYEVPPVE